MTPGAAKALDYLAGHSVMTLATHGAAGPWAAAVFYANAGFELYFLSSPRSRHAQDLAAHGAVAATIQDDVADWRIVRGVQLEGVAEALSGAEAERARALYAEKFPVARPGPETPEPIAAALARVTWYRLTVRRLYLIDNAAGFGQREQVL